MQNPKIEIKTPSEFYRNRRPENFSDSVKTYEIKLPKEQLAYELSLISTNQKQDEFETFCRKLAEKFITPNLIPQVGPTGGGDGKTDFETYPVSDAISNRWFVPENGWTKEEKWAFAISAKADWKGKLKSDIKKIKETERTYSRIYFMTNQKLSSKKKKDAQDEFNKEFEVDVIVLDGEWMLEKVYGSDLISLAVDTLNLSSVYKNEKIEVGGNDAERIKQLEEIELKINAPNRYSEYDYQIVEDSLESAILTRMLEKSKEEVKGKFDRALRFANKVNNKSQLFRIHYQRAWTYLNWYDDYGSFLDEYLTLKKISEGELNIIEMELYFTLTQLLRSVEASGNFDLSSRNIRFKDEIVFLTFMLDKAIGAKDKPSSSIIAKTYKCILELLDFVYSKQVVTSTLKTLQKCLEDGVNHLDFPFESYRKMIDVIGEILPDNEAYDDTVDVIAKLVGKRSSELAAGEVFLERGYQKLTSGFYRESIIYFGKAVIKLAKEESQGYFYFSLMGLQESYRSIGLLWAANSCLMAAISISIKSFYQNGKISRNLYYSLEQMIKNELFIGRVPIILIWEELFAVISSQIEIDTTNQENMPIDKLIDGCLSTRLANVPYNKWASLSKLPDILNKQRLWLAEDTSLFMLGYTELLDELYKQGSEDIAKMDDFFQMAAEQPFIKQMVYETDFFTNDTIALFSTVLGTKICVSFSRNKDLLLFAETILSYLESFLATSIANVYPSTELIEINLFENSSIDLPIFESTTTSSIFTIAVNCEKLARDNFSDINTFMINFFSQMVSRNFLINDSNDFLKKLFEKEELMERLSLVFEHRLFAYHILGNKPKFFLEDWIESKQPKDYPLKRTSSPIIKKMDQLKKEEWGKGKIEDVKHNQTKVSSIIDNHIWDKAAWKGFGFFYSSQIKFAIFLAFDDGVSGKLIFDNWIRQFGHVDTNEEIKVTIVKGVDKNNPAFYRVSISKNEATMDFSNVEYIYAASRFHQMDATQPSNLTNLISGFKHFGEYLLCPAIYKADGSIQPFSESGILKKSLIIKEAWEIGENDLDSVVIKKGDTPNIPSHVKNAPVLAVLKRKNTDE